MPTLTVYTERTRFNSFDAICLADHQDRTLLKGGSLRLFGVKNIGRPTYCNLQHPRMLRPPELPTPITDPSFVIFNWYVRFNLPGANTAALVEWLNSTVATLVIGERPMYQQPLSDLARRAEGSVFVRDYHATPGEIDEIAKKMCAVSIDHARRRKMGLMGGVTATSWDEVEEDGRECLRQMAIAATQAFPIPKVFVVPVRQSCHVRIDTSPAAYGKLMETLPAGISPEPLVWVHLEGVAVRDCA